MDDEARVPFVSVKLTPTARTQQYALRERPEPPLAPGERVVVQGECGPAFGTVVPTLPGTAPRRQPPAETTHIVVRRATHHDVVARLEQEHREQEAFRVALLKIRERGLQM